MQDIIKTAGVAVKNTRATGIMGDMAIVGAADTTATITATAPAVATTATVVAAEARRATATSADASAVGRNK